MARLDDQETMKGSEMGTVDDNNNSDSNSSSPEEHPDAAKSPGPSGGKYQLRPRSVHARRLCDNDWSFGESLRHKPRAAPLSRYRRKTANARERYRMRQINTAFESLRGVLPSWVCSRRAASDMTKIATLRLASAYIRSLQDILDGSAPQDTCSWVLSAILDNTPSGPQKPASPIHQASSGQFLEHQGQGADLVSILTGASSHQVFQDNLESFCYMSPVSHEDDFLLACEPPRVWSEA